MVINLFVLSFSIIAFNQQINAQTCLAKTLPAGISQIANVNLTDTLQVNTEKEKNYWLPAVEVMGLNFGVWAYNRYLSSEGWSNISWKSIKRNFENGFEWDKDGYLMNQFWHPYHGSNYFNLARSNGLEFWESLPYVLGGSLMWEYFMESEPPSYNDIVNTPVTGVILGEISYRVSNLIIDESKTGFERFLREFTSTLINPMQGLNRLIRGDMWRLSNSPEETDYNFVISSGVHNVFFSGKINNSKSYATIRVDLNYGNLFSVKNHKKPFDYFTLRTEFNLAPNDNIGAIFASGVLWDRNIKLFKESKNIIGIYKEVDIHINTVYKLSATSVTGQIINTILFSSTISMQNYFGFSAILMGGTNSHYASEYGKDYNIGPGAGAKLGVKIKIDNYGDIYTNYKRYWIHTLSGAESEEFVGLFNAGINYQLSTRTFLGLDYLLYERFGDYKYFPNTTTTNSALRMYVKQKI